MDWPLSFPVDSALCGIFALVLTIFAFRHRSRLAASTPAAAVFLVLLTVPVLIGIARLHRPLADSAVLQAVAVQAYAMLLGMMVPLAIVLVVMERSRRRWEIRRCRDDIEDLRGWKNPAAAVRIRGLVRRLSRLGITGLDLTRCHLRQMNLAEMGLAGSRLVGADLEAANLSGSNLAGADLQGAALRRAVLRRTNLAGAILWGADLREAVLARADLHGALLKEANLAGADFSGARLTEVRGLTADQLSGARSLSGADLSPALQAEVKERYPALLRAG
ncbi:MAG: pentapeptide repeat-containing protein [Desulfobacterales bacterium]|jgi:hypothetical protein